MQKQINKIYTSIAAAFTCFMIGIFFLPAIVNIIGGVWLLLACFQVGQLSKMISRKKK